MHTDREVTTFRLLGAVAAVPTVNKRMMESIRWNGPFETGTSPSFPLPLTAVNQLCHHHFAGEENRHCDEMRFDVHDLSVLHSTKSKRVALRRETCGRWTHTSARREDVEIV